MNQLIAAEIIASNILLDPFLSFIGSSKWQLEEGKMWNYGTTMGLVCVLSVSVHEWPLLPIFLTSFSYSWIEFNQWKVRKEIYSKGL